MPREKIWETLASKESSIVEAFSSVRKNLQSEELKLKTKIEEIETYIQEYISSIKQSKSEENFALLKNKVDMIKNLREAKVELEKAKAEHHLKIENMSHIIRRQKIMLHKYEKLHNATVSAQLKSAERRINKEIEEAALSQFIRKNLEIG